MTALELARDEAVQVHDPESDAEHEHDANQENDGANAPEELAAFCFHEAP